jgi:Tfp pilus assembly protein PilN
VCVKNIVNVASIQLKYSASVAVVVSAAISFVILVILRKWKISVQAILNRNQRLQKEDIVVIEFLAENNGEAFEAEIRNFRIWLEQACGDLSSDLNCRSLKFKNWA